MKKIILSILAIALVCFTVSAKKKASPAVTVDFTQGNPLTAVQGTTPEKVSITTPAFGLVIPSKFLKTAEDLVAAGYVSNPNTEKGEEGFYFPYSRQSFQSNGTAYEFTIGTQPAKGRKNYLYFRKNTLSASRFAFTFPAVKGMIPAGVKLTVKTGKKVNERMTFGVYNGKINKKALLATSTAPQEPNAEAVLSATLENLTEAGELIVASNTSFAITKIEFLYNKAPKAAKAKKAKK